jgi:hypothetical protein
MDNPFSWDYLTTVPGQDEVFGPFSVLFAIVFGLGFLAASFYATRPWAPPLGGRFKKRFVARSATIVAWITGIGLFFFLIRILQINPLSFGMRIWLWLSLVALALAFGWFAVQAREARRSNVPAVGSKSSQRTVNQAVTHRRPRPVRRRRA